MILLSTELDADFQGLPAEGLIRQGLADFAAGRESIGGFLVQIGAPRLRLLGIRLPEKIDGDADYKLYAFLEKSHGNEAHSQYNSYLRELVSFERGLERRISARERAQAANPR